LFNPTRARASLKLFEKSQTGILGDRLLFATDWPVPSFPVFLIDKIGLSSYKEISSIKKSFFKRSANQRKIRLSYSEV